MPSRKQRRRREKGFRHEWEYVEVDPETGEERPVEPAVLKAEKPQRERKPAQSGKQQRRGSARREPQPASWRKVWKRTALFAPLMALFIYWTSSSAKGGTNVAAILVNTVILVAFFAPFSYFVDSMTYRMYTKRLAKTAKS
jgi:hypothetical protein